MSPRSCVVSPVAALILAAAFWALGTVISKMALASVPPITFLVVQLAPSVVVLWLLVLAMGARPAQRGGRVSIALLGLLNPGLAYTLSMLGLARTSASVASLLWAAEPALIVAIAWLILREEVTIRLLTATAAAACGVILVSGLANGPGGPGLEAGDVLILAGMACCALYSVLSRKIATTADPLFIVALQQTIGLIWAATIWPLEGSMNAGQWLPMLSTTEWLAATVSGLMYYAAAFWLYLVGLRSVPASVAGGFLNLIPVFAIATAYLVLDERLSLGQWVGAVIILAAVLALPSGSRRTDAPVQAG